MAGYVHVSKFAMSRTLSKKTWFRFACILIPFYRELNEFQLEVGFTHRSLSSHRLKPRGEPGMRELNFPQNEMDFLGWLEQGEFRSSVSESAVYTQISFQLSRKISYFWDFSFTEPHFANVHQGRMTAVRVYSAQRQKARERSEITLRSNRLRCVGNKKKINNDNDLTSWWSIFPRIESNNVTRTEFNSNSILK